MSDILKLVLFVAIILAVVLGGPIATIIAINTLFGLSIEVNVTTWLASFWLTSIVSGGIAKFKAK